MRQLGRPVVVAWIVIFAIALALRCGASVYWQQQQVDQNAIAFGDSFSYWVLGHQIYEGNESQIINQEVRMGLKQRLRRNERTIRLSSKPRLRLKQSARR